MTYTETHPVTNRYECKTCKQVMSGDDIHPDLSALFLLQHNKHEVSFVVGVAPPPLAPTTAPGDSSPLSPGASSQQQKGAIT